MSEELEETNVLEPKVIGNEILFFSDITEESILDFLEAFKKLENETLKKYVDNPGSTPCIKVVINSGGGDLFSGIAAMNIIEKSRVKVITEVQGSCCSAATFLLLAGHERLMGKDAFILIHQITTGQFWGKFQELKAECKNCSKFMKRIETVYRSKTKIPDKLFKKMMKKDVFMDSAECLKHGIVHEIA